jgi:hypothetical protein
MSSLICLATTLATATTVTLTANAATLTAASEGELQLKLSKPEAFAWGWHSEALQRSVLFASRGAGCRPLARHSNHLRNMPQAWR